MARGLCAIDPTLCVHRVLYNHSFRGFINADYMCIVSMLEFVRRFSPIAVAICLDPDEHGTHAYSDMVSFTCATFSQYTPTIITVEYTSDSQKALKGVLDTVASYRPLSYRPVRAQDTEVGSVRVVLTTLAFSTERLTSVACMRNLTYMDYGGVENGDLVPMKSKCPINLLYAYYCRKTPELFSSEPVDLQVQRGPPPTPPPKLPTKPGGLKKWITIAAIALIGLALLVILLVKRTHR